MAAALSFFSVGLLIAGAGVYFGDGAVLGIGVLIAAFGAYCVAQTAVALLLDMTIGYRGLGAVLCFVILGYFVVQGYTLLIE